MCFSLVLLGDALSGVVLLMKPPLDCNQRLATTCYCCFVLSQFLVLSFCVASDSPPVVRCGYASQHVCVLSARWFETSRYN